MCFGSDDGASRHTVRVMKAACWALVLLTMSGCGNNESTSAGAPAGAAVPVEKPVEQPKQTEQRDAAFVAVDRDQLKALCLAQQLPRTSSPPQYGALVLASGKRVPWLAFTTSVKDDWINAEIAHVERKPLLAGAWLKEMTALMTDVEPPTRPDTLDTQYRLCDRDAAATVVVSAVFFQKDGIHLIAARGRSKPIEKVFANTTSVQDVYGVAFSLMEQVLGDTIADIASHQVTPRGDRQPTISDERWIRGLKPNATAQSTITGHVTEN
jgi:hypothetical protein